ncbi:MAG: hypothetical protein L0Y39_02395 [Methylococcaceae bacterium]|nr:hypothetical protein [Methylococcaceae bacterium]
MKKHTKLHTPVNPSEDLTRSQIIRGNKVFMLVKNAAKRMVIDSTPVPNGFRGHPAGPSLHSSSRIVKHLLIHLKSNDTKKFPIQTINLPER